MMNAYSWSFALYLLLFEAYSSAYLLTTSSDKATTGIDFNFTCYFPSIDYMLSISRDNTRECSFRSYCRLSSYNQNYTCTCSGTTIILTIPGSFDIDTLHGSQWMCKDLFFGGSSNKVMLNVNVPIKQVNLIAIPNDINPTDILSGSSQHFTCTTDAGRPSSRIQWYMSGVNITDDAVVQADTCNPGCTNKVISSSVLVYIGHITDNGKTIYCTAFNIDAEAVRSQDRGINILFKPVILEIPDYNITEGSNLKITPSIDANPDPISVWWTRQNNPGFIYVGTNLTIRSIQRVSSDNYTCHAMNTITAPGHPTKNRTSEEMFNVYVQFLQRYTDSNNNTAVGVGTGIAVIIVIIGVTILNLFLYRKRRMSKTKVFLSIEQSNTEVYETELNDSRQMTQTDTHFYNELGDLKTDAKQTQKSPKRSSNSYEDFGEEKSNTAGNTYENMKISDNELQKHHRETALYVNMDL
ncbi:uncharacterized protein LOC127712344 isoform X1 [Mytilus californianus]|uniref:uncharacterized protein LOC127712344 isoform X1 n=1 Tax=Mytilus californianus TaxID=6549 RepID=UPI002246A18F|nr:uncharacterized protein LOC127712344 isoform X1 [Mytilus californianus]